VTAWAKLVEDYRSSVWGRNGFPNWETYCTAMYPAPPMTPKERIDRIAMLREEGIPFRAIGPAVGMSGTSVFKAMKRAETQGLVPPRTTTKKTHAGPMRRALPLVMRKPAVDLGRVTRRLSEIMNDQRFERNRAAIAREYGPQIRIAHDELSAFVAAMDKP
jgi:hypothetical protein